MKLAGAELANTLGNIVERNACQDLNTGFAPVALAAAPQGPKPTQRFDLN